MCVHMYQGFSACQKNLKWLTEFVELYHHIFLLNDFLQLNNYFHAVLTICILEVKKLRTGNICWVIYSVSFCHRTWFFTVHLPVLTVLGLEPLPSLDCFLSCQQNWPLVDAQANQSAVSRVHEQWRIILGMPLPHQGDKEEKSLQSSLRRLFGIFFSMSNTNFVVLEIILLITDLGFYSIIQEPK